MITGIREKTVVKQGGKIEIESPELREGEEVDVIILIGEEQDTTEYLLSTEANRRHLEQALRDAEDPTKRIYVDIDNL